MKKEFDRGSMSILEPPEIEELRVIKERLDAIFMCFNRMQSTTDKLNKKYQYHMIELYYCFLLQHMKDFLNKVEKRFGIKEDNNNDN